jgi:hypothetical protein
MSKKTKYKNKIVIAFIIVAITVVSVLPFIINCAYLMGTSDGNRNTAFSASDMLSLYGTGISFIGTMTLGIIAVWQTILARQQTDKANKFAEKAQHQADASNELAKQANDVSLRFLSLEEQDRTPLLYIIRERCSVEKVNDKIKISLGVKNISNYLVHNIKLVIEPTGDEEIITSYNEKNFYSWMKKIAQIPDGKVKSSSKNIDFVAELWGKYKRAKKSLQNGNTEEITLEEHDGLMTFFVNYPLHNQDDFMAMPIKFFMQNINGKLYKQSSTIYIMRKSDKTPYFLFNHSTRVELCKARQY